MATLRTSNFTADNNEQNFGKAVFLSLRKMQKSHTVFLFLNLACGTFAFAQRSTNFVLCILTLLFSIDTFGQVGGNLYDRSKNFAEEYIIYQQSQTFMPTPTPLGFIENPVVTTARQFVYTPTNPAQNLISQQNQQARQMMNRNPKPTQTDIDEAMKNQLNGKPPALTEEEKQRKEITDLLNEVHSREPTNAEYWKAPDFAEKEKPYYDALNKLKEQLEGKRNLSVADAYFNAENAEGNAMLKQKEFKDEINKCATFIQRWMMENELDLSNNLAVHFAIQKFFSDTLKIGKHLLEIPDVKPQTHLPFYYDYDDYKAEKDNRSYHLTKGFATGNGQCHILPLMYSCIAEALGATFYLSYAPLHSFIKYPDKENKIHNYEPTTNWQISDQWYKDNLEVTALAEKRQIYLSKMDRKQIVAAAIMDLAYLYKKNNGVADGNFINECVDFAMNYFPNKEANIEGWRLRGIVTAKKLDRIAAAKGVKSVEDIEKIPETKEMLDKLHAINRKIEALGYTDVDIATYDQMVEDSKARHPEAQGKNNLQKRNLFIPLNPK